MDANNSGLFLVPFLHLQVASLSKWAEWYLPV
jgi:hypothetical protein